MLDAWYLSPQGLFFLFLLGMLVLALILRLLFYWHSYQLKESWELLGCKRSPFNTNKHMVIYRRGKEYRIYEGSSTVWHSWPDGARQGTFREDELGDLAVRARYACQLGENGNPMLQGNWDEKELLHMIGRPLESVPADHLSQDLPEKP